MKEVMTPKEVAEYLRVHVRTIYRLAKSKQIPSLKVGGSWRFMKEDVESWLSETKCSASPRKGARRPEKGVALEFPKSYEGEGQPSL